VIGWVKEHCGSRLVEMKGRHWVSGMEEIE